MAKAGGTLPTFAVWLFLSAPLPVHGALPSVIGSFSSEISGKIRDFDTQEERGCIVTRRGHGPELYVLDLHDPSHPSLLGSLDLAAHANRVALQGDLAYVATSQPDGELLVVDLSDPASPGTVGSYDTPTRKDAISLAVDGPLLFLGTKRATGTNHHELFVVDISNPALPHLIDSVEVGADVNDLVLEGATLYAATSHRDREVIVFDVSNPSAVSVVNWANLEGSADARGIDVHRGLIYAVRRDRRDNFVVLDATSLTHIATRSLNGRPERVKIFRDRAYVAIDGNVGMKIVDIGKPSQPSLLHNIGEDAAADVHVAPPYAFVASRNIRDGLLVVDARSLLRPNVVIVYTDDLHPRAIDFMPQVQQLASQGLSFRESFATSPHCGPSRASLLTGLYTHNHGAIRNGDYIGAGPQAIGSDDSTLATWMQGAGYRTGFFGKYVNGYPHECGDGSCNIPPGWDDWQAKAVGMPGKIYYDYGISNNGILESHGNQPEDYSTDVLKQKSLDFIGRQDNRPFLAILSVDAPHLHDLFSVPPAPRHAGAFDGIPPWRPPSYDEEDVSDKPAFYSEAPRAAETFGFFTFGSWLDLLRQQQLESLLSVDEAPGGNHAASGESPRRRGYGPDLHRRQRIPLGRASGMGRQGAHV